MENEKRCSHCGMINAPDFKFCLRCGLALSKENNISPINATIPIQVRYCKSCGAAVPPYATECLICGAILIEDTEIKLQGFQLLREILTGAKRIIINDPYFFRGDEHVTTKEYIVRIMDILPLDTLAILHIFHQGGMKSHKYIRLFQDRINNYEIDLQIRVIHKVHDRIWVVDDNRGYLVGTSLNGFGKRLSFLVPLPNNDLEYFKEFVSKEVGL